MIGDPPDLSEISVQLATLCARYCYLPNPQVADALDGAVFPTIRAKPRGFVDEEKGVLYDTNVTPSCAILWSHGIMRDRPKRGWMVAHVWPTSKDPSAYTRLANLAIVPECLGSLTDKDGPLTSYFRHHAYRVYGWKPTDVVAPKMPAEYASTQFNYLPENSNPKLSIETRLRKLNNDRVRKLRPLMGLGD